MISRIGRFEIQAEIGHGGFGRVYRAFDPLMKRVVAIKVLTATEDVASFTRFVNEAIAAGNLHHENIVTVYDSGQDGKTHYLVMEYLDGKDLQQVLKTNVPLSLYQKIRVMDQVADGLHCAHRKGVLHRDVKPANIMVLQDNAVKIMDFGIARLTRDTSTRLTQQGYLIGTVVYMAPELFSGEESEVDALCDIWSYGVIMYELLTGKNPFQTGSMASEMNLIINQDPPPLPADVPPEVQAVVGRLLSKDRQYRYQTLEDTRFDLQPILKNLEKDEADRLLSNAQQLMFRKQWSEALSAAREARRMDPQNGTARIIFERAQSELQRLSALPRIDDLLRRSTDAVEKRNLEEAINLLDAARKLDTRNERVMSRLQDLRALKARLEEAAKLVSEAGKELLDKRLTAAFEHASQAISLDPDNAEARRLFETIDGEIRAREADRELENEIRRVRGLMATTDDLDGALEIVRAIEAKYPGRGAVKELLTKLTLLIAERERRRRLDHAKDLVRKTRFEEGVAELDQLLASFPNEVEAIDLRNFAMQELRAKRRSDDVKRTSDAAAELNRAQRFPEAIRLLEEALGRYPDDLALGRLLRSTHADLQNFERERALQTGLQQCENLRRRGQWKEALDLIGRLAGEHPSSREVLDLERTISQEKIQAEQAAAVRSAVDQSNAHLRRRDPDSAVAILEAAILTMGPDRELTESLQKAKDAQRADRERQYIESELKHAKGFEQRGDINTSLQIIEQALLRSPKSPELLKAQEWLKKLLDREHHDRHVSEHAAAIEDALKRKEWPDVQEKLDAVTKMFPAETVFTELQEELRRRKSAEIDHLIREGRRLRDTGQLAEAERFCLANLKDYREVPEVISLVQGIQDEKKRRKAAEAEEAQKAKFVAECLRSAQEREQKGDVEAAVQILAEGLSRYPGDPDLPVVHERVNRRVAEARRHRVFSSIEQALAASNWQHAIELLDEARRQYPTDPELIVLYDKALDQRSAFLDRAAAAIRGKLEESKLDDARSLFTQNLARYQDQSIVRTVESEIAAAESRRASEEQKNAFVSENLKEAERCEQQADLARAATTLRKALKKYPGEARLSAALKRVDAASQAADRDRTLGTHTGAIRKELDRGNWAEALKKLADARSAVPDNPQELAALEQQARSVRERELQSLLNTGNEYLKTGNLAEAEKVHKKQLALFAGDPSVSAFAGALNEARLCDNLSQTARSHTAARRFDEAETAINELAARRFGDPVERTLRAALEGAREQDRKDKLYRAGRSEGDQMLRNRQYAEAIVRFEYLLTQFPGDRQLQRDLEGAIAAEKRSKNITAERTLPAEPPKRQPRIWIYALSGVVVVASAGLAYLFSRPAHISFSQNSVKLEAEPGTRAEARFIATGPSNIALPRASADWVTVSRSSSGSGRTEFVVQSAVNLAPGEYSAELTFPSHENVHVDLVVHPKPTGTGVDNPPRSWDVQPPSLSFTDSRGKIAPQKITVESSSEIPEPKKSTRWISTKRSSLGPHKAEFLVSVSASGLPPGTHTAYLVFDDKQVPVLLTIPGGTAEAPLEVHPLSLSFSDTQGPMRGVVIGSGPKVIQDPKATEKWLSITRHDLGNGMAEFTVVASAEGLDAGKTYQALLLFPQQKTVPVRLTLAPKATPPPFDARPTELSFTYNRITPVSPKIIEVTGPPDIADPQTKATWLTVSRLGAQGNKVRFSVQVVSPEKLEPNDYHDELTFAQYQKKVRVDLTVFTPQQPFCNLSGTSVWSPGAETRIDELDIKAALVVKGSGRVSPPLPACEIVVDGSKLPEGWTVVANPSQANNFTLRLKNSSGTPPPSFMIGWTKKVVP